MYRRTWRSVTVNRGSKYFVPVLVFFFSSLQFFFPFFNFRRVSHNLGFSGTGDWENSLYMSTVRPNGAIDIILTNSFSSDSNWRYRRYRFWIAISISGGSKSDEGFDTRCNNTCKISPKCSNLGPSPTMLLQIVTLTLTTGGDPVVYLSHAQKEDHDSLCNINYILLFTCARHVAILRYNGWLS